MPSVAETKLVAGYLRQFSLLRNVLLGPQVLKRHHSGLPEQLSATSLLERSGAAKTSCYCQHG